MTTESNPNLKKIFLKFVRIPKGSHYEVNFVTAPNIDGYLAILSVDNSQETHIYRFWPWVRHNQVMPYVASKKAFDLIQKPLKKEPKKTLKTIPNKPLNFVSRDFRIPKPGQEVINVESTKDSIKSTESDNIAND